MYYYTEKESVQDYFQRSGSFFIFYVVPDHLKEKFEALTQQKMKMNLQRCGSTFVRTIMTHQQLAGDHGILYGVPKNTKISKRAWIQQCEQAVKATIDFIRANGNPPKKIGWWY